MVQLYGGINGREINLTLYGAAISDYQPQMETACGNEFVMVGSGAVQDSLWPETGAACGLVEISTFAVTPTPACRGPRRDGGHAHRPAVPNPSDLFQVTSGEIVAEEFPEAVEERGILYGDLETLIVQQARNVEAWEQVGGTSSTTAPTTSWARPTGARSPPSSRTMGSRRSPSWARGNFALLQQAMQEAATSPR